ncbi:50S ribosomal protein L35 [Candidatus Margulisiibacteriota bacterium]
MAKNKKLKTRKSASKRFKLTSKGKLKRNNTGRRHILGAKPANKQRAKKLIVTVSKSDAANIKEMIPYS